MGKLLCMLIVCVAIGIPVLIYEGILPHCPPTHNNGDIVPFDPPLSENPRLGRVTNVRWVRPPHGGFGHWECDIVPIDNRDD